MRKFEVAKGFEGRDITMPERKTKLSAGYDICALERTICKPGVVTVVTTGVKACMNDCDFLALYIRSSLAFKQNLGMVNSVGVVDADYYGNPDNDGHIMIGLRNFGDTDVYINAGDRIAQGIFHAYFVTADDKAAGERVGGIGSTNK